MRFSLSLAVIDRLVDTTGPDGQFDFVVGSGEIIPGLEKCLMGMEVGEKGEFKLSSDEAYGPVPADDGLIQQFTLDDFPEEMKLDTGLVIGFQSPNGDETPGTIVQIDGDVVTVDFSHPLAGYDLVFEVEILDVQPNA